MNLDAAVERLDSLVARVPSSSGRIELTVAGRVATLTLVHPEARNALTAGMMRELAGHVWTLQGATEVCALVIQSAEGGAFCAGGHLREVQEALGTPEAGRTMALAMGAVLDALAAMPITSIAALEGPAIGGGAEVAITADLRVMGSGSALHFVHTRLGVVPGWGGAGRLVDRVGRDRALRILLEADRMDARVCEVMGLAEVVPAGMAAQTAQALAARIARRGPAARAAKAAVTARGMRTAEQREAEAEAFASVWGREMHRAALARVLEKLS